MDFNWGRPIILTALRRNARFAVVASMLAWMFLSITPASANHSWGTYHWARNTSEFTLQLGDNVNASWDSYLSVASADWTQSSVLNTTVVTGRAANVKKCAAVTGRVEVCNATYGNNGWLGIAGISLSGGHIVKGYVKLNDSYFNTASYNTPEWRALVMCQEVGHTFGLDHQDETHNNYNLGSCMDYTNDPDGGSGGFAGDDPRNDHPNTHDYTQLATIYGHTDASNTAAAPQASSTGASRSRIVDVDSKGNGTVTFITWVDGH